MCYDQVTVVRLGNHLLVALISSVDRKLPQDGEAQLRSRVCIHSVDLGQLALFDLVRSEKNQKRIIQ